MADAFTQDKFAWLEQVQDDVGLGPTHVGLAVAVGRHLNRKTGDAWPGQAKLAKIMRLQPRQLRTLLRQLEERGHLEITSGGFQKPDRYRPVLADRQSTAAFRPAIHCRSENAPDRQSIAAQTGNGLPPNTLREPTEEEVRVPSIPQTGRQAFEQWWAAYPKRVKRLKAEKLFANTLRQGLATAEQLIDAATVYAASDKVRRGFAMDPTTWLNGGCWADEPEPVSQHLNGHGWTATGQAARTLFEEG